MITLLKKAAKRDKTKKPPGEGGFAVCCNSPTLVYPAFDSIWFPRLRGIICSSCRAQVYNDGATIVRERRLGSGGYVRGEDNY